MVRQGDNWETPASAFQYLAAHVRLPKNAKIVWDPFFSTGRANKNIVAAFPSLRLVHVQKDFFSYVPACDVIITNPPYSKMRKVLTRLLEIGKPFAVIIPNSTLYTKYMRDCARRGTPLQVLVPSERVSFLNPRTGTPEMNPPFHAIWLTYKMPLNTGRLHLVPTYFE